ncbi:hypothetical protein NQ315_013391 [Exocentrus adspersus]|uniref:GH16 domain-containing protein n=1 Tax=Exocentrus adspersus TaxID=1586481 RepID=A0AAV8VS25_9CUCU|nr:hypothetical protein NQ315_013391 [Exocentrus adspersus]
MSLTYISLVVIIFFELFQRGNTDCDVASVTTASGTQAPEGKICPGDLIFEDTFDKVDLSKWQYEISLWGGGSVESKSLIWPDGDLTYRLPIILEYLRRPNTYVLLKERGCFQGGNYEFQWYNNDRNNSYTEDGIYHIRPTLLADDTGEDFLYSGTIDLGNTCTNSENYGCRREGTTENVLNPIKSSRIHSIDTFSFKYGKVEARAKVPAGDWLWPAFWMMPRYSVYSGWPASGEIDIMESRGNKQLIGSSGVNIGAQQVGSTMHWGPNYNVNKFLLTHWEQNNDAGYDVDFHNYQLEWTPEKIEFSVDDVIIGSVSPPEGGFWELGSLSDTGLENPWINSTNIRMAPFDQEFFLIINLAVGGTGYFPDDATNPGGKPWLNTSPHAATDFWKGEDQWLPTWNRETDSSHLQVDYVRVWAL